MDSSEDWLIAYKVSENQIFVKGHNLLTVLTEYLSSYFNEMLKITFPNKVNILPTASFHT